MCTTAQPCARLGHTIVRENDVWMMIAGGIAVAVIVAVARLCSRNESDLGSVTETWLTEYRSDEAADSK